jgi:hypothetical protein
MCRPTLLPTAALLGVSSLIVPPSARAAELETVVVEDAFDTESAHWTGGTLSDGVLELGDHGATLDLTHARSLSATLRLRQRDAAALSVALSGRGTTSLSHVGWVADYADGGGIFFRGDSGAEEPRHFPHGHRSWVTEPDPALTPDPSAAWEAGGLLHSEVRYDATSAAWFLYYTGVMSPGYGYRQLGLATSPDGSAWTRDAANPLITVDYSTTTVDGVHAHMPTVVVDSSGTWHLYYSCYENAVGNRICHATSPDGREWTRPDYGAGRVALDLGESGAFDDASLREPEVAWAADGSLRMFYVGTRAGEHYGPAGLARSDDGGWTWERVAQVTSGESELQGGSVLPGPFGLEHWYQCGPSICFAESLPDPTTGELDWTAWTLFGSEPVLEPAWADWNRGYIQAPTVALGPDGQTLHLWFNASNGVDTVEVLGHARTTPRPDAWLTLQLEWHDDVLTVAMDGAAPFSTPLLSISELHLSTTGSAQLDEARLEWTQETEDSVDSGVPDSGLPDGSPDSGGAEDDPGPTPDDGADGDKAPEDADTTKTDAAGGCGGCATAASAAGHTTWALAALVAWRRRRPQR